jgi:drug/metabolite transporter (DMT)-like permease
MVNYYGEIAALLAALSWTSNAVLFTLAGKRVGSFAVNYFRIVFGFSAMLIIHLAVFGQVMPLSAGAGRWGWLAMSGIIGFALGDGMLLEALLLIGPRLTMLMQVLAPVFSALLGFIFLGERLAAIKLAAIAITITGVAIVVNDHEPTIDRPVRGARMPGILLALGGALGQAVGLLFSKKGMMGGTSPISANAVRLAGAFAVLTVFTLLHPRQREELAKIRQLVPTAQIFSGTMAGTVLGVILSLYAISKTNLGVASTLMSLAPVFLLPVGYFMFKEKVSLRAGAGTLIALVGVAMLFFT